MSDRIAGEIKVEVDEKYIIDGKEWFLIRSSTEESGKGSFAYLVFSDPKTFKEDSEFLKRKILLNERQLLFEESALELNRRMLGDDEDDYNREKLRD